MISASLGRNKPNIGSGEEQRDAQTVRRELVAMTSGNALDDAMQPQAAITLRSRRQTTSVVFRPQLLQNKLLTVIANSSTK